MVFRERQPLSPEREALLSSRDPYFRLRQEYLSFVNWKSVTLGVLAGLIPFILYFAIIQSYGGTEAQPGKLHQLSHSALVGVIHSSDIKSEKRRLPVLKSILNSPNWKKISHKKFRKHEKTNPGVHEPTEFGTYPQPTFTLVGNKTVALYQLIVTKGILSPDGFPQPAYLINGQSPGPEIRVKQYSILIVRVENHLDTSITLHFHGIHQRKSFLSDGVPHVTQEAIPPGASYTYTMNLWPQVGTYFYHAHTNMDIVWLYGPLVIEDNSAKYRAYPEDYQYDEDRVFILNGVYHENLTSLVKRITGPIHDYPALINSITINGRSFVEWTNNVTGKDLSAPSEYGYDITAVQPGKRYRFRFINAASDSILSCNISSHTLKVIEMDGIYSDPITTDHIVISPGQRYSFIVNMDQADANYYIICRHMDVAGPLNGIAVLKYFNASKPTQEMLNFYRNGSTSSRIDRWIVDKLTPNQDLNQTDFYYPPIKLDQEFVVDVREAVRGQSHVYLLNGHYFEEPAIPYYIQLKNGVNITNIPQVYEILEGEAVQFVFQNTRTGNFCFSHPWHIHGRDFHVVGEGPNKYDPTTDGLRIQKDIESGKKFMLRDTVTVYANQTEGEFMDGAYCGWAAVRFEAHNSGLWLAHCHVTPHLIMGKRFLIWEHSKEDPMLIKLMSAKYDYKLSGGW